MMTVKIILMAGWITVFNGCGIKVHEIHTPGFTTQTWIQIGNNSFSYGGEKIVEEEPEIKTYVDSEYLSELAYNSEGNSWN